MKASVPRLISLTEIDIEILRAVNVLRYITATQLSRLLYASGERSAQRRLKRLSDGGYLLRLRALPIPRYGSAPHVFTLGNRGRRALGALGIEATSPYMRPSEEQEVGDNGLFMQHTLAAVDVLVAALALCRDTRIKCPRLLNERQLRRKPTRVRLPDGRETAVIPDGFLQFQLGQEPPISIALELDRGTEEQKRWRQKVQALVSWASGPYQEAFATDNLTLAVVAPTAARRERLRDWTRRELAAIGREELGELFLFTSESPVQRPAFDFFCSPLWHTLDGGRPVGLLEESDPQPAERQAALVPSPPG